MAQNNPDDNGRVRISGELDAVSVPRRLRKSEDWFAPGRETAIDLSGVARADSAGVALLLDWMRQAREQDATLSFHNAPRQMRAIIDFCALKDVIPLADSAPATATRPNPQFQS